MQLGVQGCVLHQTPAHNLTTIATASSPAFSRPQCEASMCSASQVASADLVPGGDLGTALCRRLPLPAAAGPVVLPPAVVEVRPPAPAAPASARIPATIPVDIVLRADAISASRGPKSLSTSRRTHQDASGTAASSHDTPTSWRLAHVMLKPAHRRQSSELHPEPAHLSSRPSPSRRL